MTNSPDDRPWSCPINPFGCDHVADAEAAIEHITTHDARLVATVLFRETYINRSVGGALERIEREAEEDINAIVPDPLADDVVFEIRFSDQ